MSGWLSLEFGMPIRMERFLQTDNRLRSGHTLTIDMKGHCEPEQGPPLIQRGKVYVDILW